MNPSTLQDICYNSLYESISTMPPLIQEAIIKQTKKKMKVKIKKKMERNVKKRISQFDTRITSEITTFIMLSNGVYTMNDIKAKYPDMCPLILQCVVSTIEKALEVIDYRITLDMRHQYYIEKKYGGGYEYNSSEDEDYGEYKKDAQDDDCDHEDYII